MKNLNVFSFNQHWFHLGSMVENVLDQEKNFQETRIYLFQQHLRTLPTDMHFRFPLSRFLKNSPEKIATNFLVRISNSTREFVNLERRETSNFEIPRNIEKLKEYKIDNLQVGMAIASHLISLTKDSQPRIDLYSGQIESCLQFYEDAKFWFAQQAYNCDTDEIWVCNGRTFHERIIAELAKQRNLRVSYYEIGGEGQVPNRWILHDVSPHNRSLHQTSIARHFDLKKPDEKEIEKWFLAHENPNLNRFASKSRDNERIQELTRKPFVVYFSSSDDEVSAISSEWNSPWGNQLLAVKSAMEVFSEQNKYNLVVRVHPNQGNKSKNDRKAWDNLKAKENCFIIPYSEPFDSYELMRKSAAVLTHGSTMGVEAAFRKKPQAFLSPARFDQLIPAIRLEDKESIVKWLSNLETGINAPSEREFAGSIMWANYMLTAGSNWKHVTIKEKSGRKVGYLQGKSLRPRTLYLVLSRLYVSIYRAVIENRLRLLKMN